MSNLLAVDLFLSDFLKIALITWVISIFNYFKTKSFMSSRPAALSTFKFDNNFKIPFAFILISGIKGYLHFRFSRISSKSAWILSEQSRPRRKGDN